MKSHSFAVIGIALLLLVGTDYLNAWTVPASAPPDGNAPAPLNVGDENQVKSGGVSVGSLHVTGGAQVDGTAAAGDMDLTVNGNIAAAQYCDQNGENCNSGGGGSSPAGMIAPFYSSTCPAGWVPANGANGTPDLRGEFIRGLDSGRGVDWGRTLGSWQGHMFASHRHYVAHAGGPAYWNQHSPTVYYYTTMSTMGSGGWEEYVLNSHYAEANAGRSSLTGGAETRPRNIALLYCMST